MFKPYPAYKPADVSVPHSIPSHWQVKKLSQIAYMKGRIGWQGLKQSEFTDEGPYLITGMNFKDGIIRWDEVYHISEARYMEAPEIQLGVGDVLMTKDGSIGKLLFVDWLPDRASLNSHLLVLRPLKGEFVPKYLYYLLDSDLFQAHIELMKTGTTFFGISQEAVSRFKMLVPPLAEQQAIAIYLDDKTRKIDTLIEKKQRLIELLKEQRTAIVNQAVTKGLPAEVHHKRTKAGINPNAKMRDSGIEWIGEIPEHWEVKRLKYILRPKKGSLKTGPFGSQLKASELVERGFKVYNQRSVLDNDFQQGDGYITPEKFNELREFEIFPNDVLITTRGTIGKCAVFPEGIERGVLHPCLIRMQFNQDAVTNQYMALFIQESRSFRENVLYNSNATTIEVIYGVTLREIKIPLPDLMEQQEILDFVRKQMSALANSMDLAEKEIILLQEYRTALISEVVTGKVDVRSEFL